MFFLLLTAPIIVSFFPGLGDIYRVSGVPFGYQTYLYTSHKFVDVFHRKTKPLGSTAYDLTTLG
jgi:hypothetical protein